MHTTYSNDKTNWTKKHIEETNRLVPKKLTWTLLPITTLTKWDQEGQAQFHKLKASSFSPA